MNPHSLRPIGRLAVLLLASTCQASLQAQVEYEKNLPDLPAAFKDHEHLIREAYAGNADAEFWYGAEFQDTGRPEIAARWFGSAAAKGQKLAQHNLGRLYQNGRGVAKDDKRSFELYLKSAKQGWSHAQYDVALCYDGGRGVEADHEEALRWCELAEQSGYGDASWLLASWYRVGMGSTLWNPVKAAQRYVLAARHGHSSSANELGLMYWFGSGIEQNFQRAEKWLRVGASGGRPDCLNNIALFLCDSPLRELRNPTEAIALLHEAMEADKPHDDFRCHQVLSFALSQCDRFEEAVAQVEIAEELLQREESISAAKRAGGKAKLADWRNLFKLRTAYDGEVREKLSLSLKVPDDDILENRAWPQVGVVKQEPKLDGGKWKELLMEALKNLPDISDKPTIFEQVSPPFMGVLLDVPSIPTRRGEVDSMIRQVGGGDVEAALALAALLLTASDVEGSHKLGISLLQALADVRYPQACNLLGWLYAGTRWVPQDKLKAFQLFMSSANLLHADGQCSLGYACDMGFHGGVDLRAATQWYRRAASKRHAGAQVELGRHLMVGRGTPKNEEEGLTLIKEAASHNHLRGLMELAWLHAYGISVAKDETKAYQLFAKAADQGCQAGYRAMGMMLQRGIDGRKSSREAAELFLKAGLKHDLGAARLMAGCYLTGDGVPVDYSFAIGWLRVSIRNNQPRDLARLAMVYAACPDVKHRDPKEAVKLASAAVKGLSSDLCPEGPDVLQAAAAAAASAKDFDKAVGFEKRAGDVIRQARMKDAAFAQMLAEESDSRLKNYRTHKPFIAVAPKTGPNAFEPLEDPVLEKLDELSKPDEYPE